MLRHLVRTIDPRGLEDLFAQLDSLIYDFVRHLRGHEPKEAHDSDIIALPVRNGGLGIPLFHETAQQTYNLCSKLSKKLLLSLGYSSPDQEPPDDPHDPGDPDPPTTIQELASSTTKQYLGRLASSTNLFEKRVLLENSSFLGRRWLSILPTTKTLTIADTELEYGLQTRFLIGTTTHNLQDLQNHQSSQNPSLTCLKCTNQVKTSLNHEDTCRAASRGWIKRHN